ncbi:hypothetical protein I302_106214 [Kwoniella bestiolae CBS 10118]|uniref:3',5'-cyclic-nucleotide phosphodiesterase n=1 Tax=Kwoniella bestiolae CBS 10118 TaxID=1296100 RepID=A0A1B9G3B0_9TREE|nr:hypothetical protein I302_05339 [Kwoniella bestiolae CBS 10118]OCF25519.1 hypothetical protein I302_05339 [Kwoniella bestiolae CBS 10118]
MSSEETTSSRRRSTRSTRTATKSPGARPPPSIRKKKNALKEDNHTSTIVNGEVVEFQPTFEIIVLGSGGGPLETDCSGYLVKAASSSWEDGVLALEGGSGLGALASILSNPTTKASTLFPGLRFPPGYTTPLLQAAHVFSFLACYLITHAHLDHVGSLIMLSGSVPPKSHQHTQPPTNAISPSKEAKVTHPRPHVYGTRRMLVKLSQAYQGGLWPELGSWVPDREGDTSTPQSNGNGMGRKKRKVEEQSVKGPNGAVDVTEENYDNSCLLFSPLSTERVHRPLHPTLPISLLTYPVAHGCTSKHTYQSSAMFIRHDPSAITQSTPSTPSSTSSTKTKGKGREFLFFGDLESSYRSPGEQNVDVERGREAKELNDVIWKEASGTYKDGRLCGIFIECSYDSSRPAHLMFGHLSPPGLYHELKTLASFVSKTDERPLKGLKIFVIHIKDALVPHPSGRTAREIIMSELNELEAKGQLGVEFVETKQGDRIVI